MFLYSVNLWFLTSAVLAVAACVLAASACMLLVGRRRQQRAVGEFSELLLRLTVDPGSDGRIGLAGRPEPLESLGMAVNRLLENLEQRRAVLQNREQLFRRLVEKNHAVLVHRNQILFANGRCLTLLGAAAADVIGRPLSAFVADDYVASVDENLRRRLAGEPAAERYDVELRGSDGVLRRVELTSAVIDRDGEPALLLTALEMPPQASTPGSSSSRPRAVATLDAMGESVITVEANRCIDYLNNSAAALLGQRVDQVIGKTFPEVASLVDELDRGPLGDPVHMASTAGTRVTMGRRAVLVPANGAAERSVELGVTPLEPVDGAAAGWVLVLHDSTEWRGLTRQMTYQASHDALTGLKNRREFARRLQESMDSAQSVDSAHVLCYLDLDRFKIVNDTCGHSAGDNLLREFAAILKKAVRDSDTVGRIGGDEFALLLVGCPLEKARQIADDVVRSVGDYRFAWNDKVFSIDVSVGMVEIGHGGGSLEDIMNAADSACYVAKKQGGARVHVYSARAEANARHSGEIYWLQRLQSALRDNRFELYSQPIVHAQIDGVGGPSIEVFVRLPAESGEPGAPPAEFIRPAERHRLMPLVDRWVVQAVLSAMGCGALKVPAGRSVAINIAGQTLGDPEFLEFVVDSLDDTGANPNEICFEVTVDSVIANLERARRFMAVLHDLGCAFALDDFGGDLSAFPSLQTLPLDYLKIDGSIMRNLAQDTVNQALVTAIIDRSHSLNFRVLAEQVEDQSSLDTVQRLGVDLVQGFVIAQPEPLPMTAELDPP